MIKKTIDAEEHTKELWNMNKLIKREEALSQEYMFETIDHNGMKIVKLSQDNVARALAMIANDSTYYKAMDVDAKPSPDGKNRGSAAYWMSELKKFIYQYGQTNYADKYKEIIKAAVESVDRENGTHLNADGCGRVEITERICKIKPEELIRCLKEPEYGYEHLFEIIAEKTKAEKKPRANFSFASKFCHYACFYLFEDEETEYQDNYPIYDSTLKAALPIYIEFYGVCGKYNMNNYKSFCEALDAVRDASGNEISRNGLDQLLWYYYKGRI